MVEPKIAVNQDENLKKLISDDQKVAPSEGSKSPSGRDSLGSSPKEEIKVSPCVPTHEVSSKEKSNKYSGRLDVVRKTIFRQLKRFYKNLWKKEEYEGKTKNQDIFQLAQEFVEKHFESKEENIHLFIVALIDNKKRYSHQNKVFSQVRNEISSMMNRINKKKVNNLLSYPQFCHLMLYYFSSESSGSAEESGVDISDRQKEVNKLTRQCQNSISLVNSSEN